MAKTKGNNYVIDKDNNIARIELHRRKAENLWTIIDLEDLERVINFPYTWYAKLNKSIGKYYVYTSVYCTETKRCKPIFLHQFIMNAKGKTVDHKNNDGLDNRKENLRVVLDGNNSTNRRSRNKNNSSGYRNVSWDKKYSKWIVQLQINGKRKMLGRFDDVHEAGAFAEKMRSEYYKEFAGKN